MSGIVVGYEAVEEGRQSIAALCTRLVQLTDDLSAGLKRIDELWTGAASEGFQAAYAEWTEAAASLTDDLRYIHHQVCVAQTNFAAADTAVIATWQAD